MSNRRKPIFFTADWHLFHANSIIFDKRPFKNLTHMHESLVTSYNAIVPPNGICYFAGDMGLCKSIEMRKIVDQLNGTKVLVLGNHDKGSNAMYDIGFDVVVHGVTLYIANERVSISHCPFRGVPREDTSGMRGSTGLENWHNEYKHTRYSIEDTGQFLLHGHIHSRKDRTISKKIEGRQMDIGVTANAYRPVSLSQIESWVAKHKRGLKCNNIKS